MRAAAQSLEHSNAATDFFAVATYSSNHGVQLAAPFIRDRALIRRALSTLKPAQRDPLGVALSAGGDRRLRNRPHLAGLARAGPRRPGYFGGGGGFGGGCASTNFRAACSLKSASSSETCGSSIRTESSGENETCPEIPFGET